MVVSRIWSSFLRETVAMALWWVPLSDPGGGNLGGVDMIVVSVVQLVQVR